MGQQDQSSLTKLISMRESVDWEIENERKKFQRQLDPLIRDWKGQYPVLQDIFRKEEIDWLLKETATSSLYNQRPVPFIGFAIRTGYKDVPDLDEDGKPISRRTTAIHHASGLFRSHGNNSVVDLFHIYDRFDVNYTDELGLTHFHVACKFGCDDVIEKFFQYGQNPNYIAQKTVDPPLNLALTWGHKKTVELLLKRDADPNSPNKDGLTPLHIICQRHGDHDMLLESLLKVSGERFQEVNLDVQDNLGKTPLHLAVRYRKINVVCLLLRRGANPNLADEEGMTPLHIICMQDEVLEDNCGLALLFFNIIDEMARAVQVDAQDKFGNTPLHLAVKGNLESTARLLIRKGADLNLANGDGLTPLQLGCKINDDDELVKFFLQINEENGHMFQIDAQNPTNGNTALHFALLHDCKKVARLLLKKGANPNLSNKDGWTPIHLICEKYDNMVDVLFRVNLVRKRPLRVDGQNDKGQTALHLAVLHSNNRSVELLLRNGADANSVNYDKATPLHLICQRGVDDSLAEFFLEICEQTNQVVPFDVKDNFNRTPVQWAVANLLPYVFDLFGDRGLRLNSSGFVFPDESYFATIVRSNEQWLNMPLQCFIMRLASGAMLMVHHLGKQGYMLKQCDALQIMALWARHRLFEGSVDVDWRDNQDFATEATGEIMNRGDLSLDGLLRMSIETAADRLTSEQYYSFARSQYWLRSRESCPYRAAAARRMSDMVSRGFFRRWALDPLARLSRHRLSMEIYAMIIRRLANKDLYNICLAATGL